MRPAPPDPPEITDRLWHGISGDVGYDIGANCGQTLPLMLARFTRVHAFEPAAECAPYLDAFTGGSFTWHPIAVSDTVGQITLSAVPDKIATGQLVDPAISDMEWDPTTALHRNVDCATIDMIVASTNATRPPDFMKIDVEGHEDRVLFGAKETLAVHRPALLIEFHSRKLHESCLEIVEGFGYFCETIRHPHYGAANPLWHEHGWIRAFQR